MTNTTTSKMVRISLMTPASLECVRQILAETPSAVRCFGYRVLDVEQRGTWTFIKITFASDGFAGAERWMRSNTVTVERDALMSGEIRRFATIAQ